jgi:hypothetical protein
LIDLGAARKHGLRSQGSPMLRRLELLKLYRRLPRNVNAASVESPRKRFKRYALGLGARLEEKRAIWAALRPLESKSNS